MKRIISISKIILISISCLCSLIFILLTVRIILDTCSLPFEFSLAGFKNLFSYFNDFKDFISITFVIIGVLLVVEQINISSKANRINERSTWKNTLRDELSKVEFHNDVIAKHIYNYSDEIFDYLYETNMKIVDRSHLEKFLKLFFTNKLIAFEQSTREYFLARGQYNDDSETYSLFYFKKIAAYLLQPSLEFEDLDSQLSELYSIQVYKLKGGQIVEPNLLSKLLKIIRQE